MIVNGQLTVNDRGNPNLLDPQFFRKTFAKPREFWFDGQTCDILMETILVIDDEAPLRQLIMAALRNKGFNLLEADNGNIGIQLARAQLPDLILCDVMMPKMDGYATLNALRQDALTAAIPCILMTGRPDSAGMRQGMTMGADDYLAKPFTIDELQNSVEARLRKQKALKDLAERKLADLRSSISLALPHELFTPLSGIIGFAEIISMDSSSLQPNEVAEIGRAIHVSAKRLYRLVENFLIYAQIELLSADPQKLSALRGSKTINPHEVISNRAKSQAEQASRLNDLHLQVKSGAVSILEEYLTKIVDELTDNAFKFSEPGTPVWIRTESLPGSFSVTIEDRGHGMTSQHLANIGAYMQFERKFYEQQGSGLGLAIAKRLTEIHGGTLVIQSNPGVGTCVALSLPSEPQPV